MPEVSAEDKIRRLSRRFAKTGNPQILPELRALRFKAGQKFGAGEKALLPAKTKIPDLFSGIDGLPEIESSDLDFRHLRSAIHHHGLIIVRNFVNDTRVKALRHCLDMAFDEFEKNKSKDIKDQNEWFDLDVPDKGELVSFGAMTMLFSAGALWTTLSPKTLETVLETFEASGIRPLLRRFLGDRPCISFNKSVIRKMEPLKKQVDWHQDGSFMSENIRSLNCWIALNDCGAGTDSPGMDFIPKRFDSVVKTGEGDAKYDWTVSPEIIQTRFKDTPPVRPFFGAGDAVFFDHLCLHSTSYDPSFKTRRYAIETWFFAQAYAAENQRPIYW